MICTTCSLDVSENDQCPRCGSADSIGDIALNQAQQDPEMRDVLLEKMKELLDE